MKPGSFRSLTVFEATADKVGLLGPAGVQGIAGFCANAKAYLDTSGDYRDTIEQIQAGHNQLHGKAATLLCQLKESSADYTFEVP
jgi:hypothetical protein